MTWSTRRQMVSDGKALTLTVTLYLARNPFCLGSCEHTGLFRFFVFFFFFKWSHHLSLRLKERVDKPLHCLRKKEFYWSYMLTFSSLWRQTVLWGRNKRASKAVYWVKIEPKCRFFFAYMSKTQTLSGMCSAWKLAVCETRWVCSWNSSTSEDVENLPWLSAAYSLGVFLKQF